MKIVSWTICNTEIDFIPFIVQEHLNIIDVQYYLDTGSLDGTLEYLQEQAIKYPGKIIVEKYHESYQVQWDVEWREMNNPFPECDVRNFAINRVKQLCPDAAWLIQLDADEVFLPEVRNTIERNKDKFSISHPTLSPVGVLTPPKEFEFRNGFWLFDPHVRLWNANAPIEYCLNPSMRGKQFHCVPVFKGTRTHLYDTFTNIFVPDYIHIHLHWLYGKKLDAFMAKKGITTKDGIVKETGELNEYGRMLPKSIIDKYQQWRKT